MGAQVSRRVMSHFEFLINFTKKKNSLIEVQIKKMLKLFLMTSIENFVPNKE